MTSLVFPDINVWLALACSAHVHHAKAKAWYESLTLEELVFCRFTQLGLLRLLTTAAAMGPDVLSQRQAWDLYDAFVQGGGARLLGEPRTLDGSFRALSSLTSASSKDWADSYLAAFAVEAGAVLITFDKALAGRGGEAVLL